MTPGELATEARTRRPISAVIGSVTKLQRSGSELIGLCPFHDDHSPSLNVNDRKGAWICRACQAGGGVIEFWARYRKIGWQEAAQELAAQPHESAASRFERHIKASAAEYAANGAKPFPSDAEDRSRRAHALELWKSSQDAKGTLAEAYLKARGITRRLSPSIRFHPECWHSETKRHYPALIALVETWSHSFCGVQRIFLDPALNAATKGKAPVAPPKKTLGPLVNGAVIMGHPGVTHLGLAEGIETALAASQLYSFSVWATLGAARLSAVAVPPDTLQVLIFGDNGTAGHREAEKAAQRYFDDGFEAVTIYPPKEYKDFNDWLLAGGP